MTDLVPHANATIALPEEHFSDAQLALAKRTVAPDLSDGEFLLFMSISAKYQLDPLRGEVWPARIGGRLMPIVGRDGLLSIAERFSDYQGWEGDVVREFDTFRKRMTPDGPVVEHEYEAAGKRFSVDADGKPVIDASGEKRRGAPIGAWAIVHRAGRRPTYFYAPWAEYNKGKNAWTTNPTAMALKAALGNALKLAFNLSGLYTEADAAPGKDALDAPPPEPAWGEDDLGEELKRLAGSVAERYPGWQRPAKLRVLLASATTEEREALAQVMREKLGEAAEDPITEAEVVA